MENNEKRNKRPRIGQQPTRPASSDAREINNDDNKEGRYNDYQRPYQGRQQYNQGGYVGSESSYTPRNSYPRNTGGYRPGQDSWTPRNGNYNTSNGDGSYGQRNNSYRPEGWNPRPRNYNNDSDNTTEGEFQPRQQGYRPRQQGGYQQRQQNGYRPRNNYGDGQDSGYRHNNYRPRTQGEGNEQSGFRPRQQNGYQQRNGYQRHDNNGGNQQRGKFQQNKPGKTFTPRQRPVTYEEAPLDPNEPIRLNKYMANAGICSRREADEFIKEGLVKVNGQVVTELGTKVVPTDTIEYDEKVVTLERKVYILLNKPKDCMTTVDDPNGRMTVMDLVKGACPQRIYPVGRLDRNTTGVLLLTNDGELASKLTHPQYLKKKIYHVWTDKDITEEDMQRIADGIELSDGEIHADAISYATETDRNQAGIEIHSGKNRIVRRIFESLGYRVTKLDRVYFAGLTKKNLPRGKWRYLSQEEVNHLKMGSFE